MASPAGQFLVRINSGIVLNLTVVAVIYTVVLVIYRLFLSPLANVPGPKIAAATGWYESYYDCLRAGTYMFEIERMHKLFGPIVRISPWEVHINDPEYYDQLFSSTSKLEKDHWYYSFIASPGSTFATGPAELHQARRGTLAKYFSTVNISRLEPLIMECVQTFISRLEDHRKDAKTVDLSNAYRCFSSDIISEYALPRSRLMLQSPNFAASYNRVVRDLSQICVCNRHFPFLLPIFMAIPRHIIAKVDSGPLLAVVDNQAVSNPPLTEKYPLITYHTQYLNDGATKIHESGGVSPPKSHPTILHEIYNSDLPHSEKSVPRLAQEALALVGAGTETTGNTLSLTTFYLLLDPAKAQRLRKELSTVKLDKTNLLNYQQLRNLPYLVAVIAEGLRIASGVSGRLPRINPTEKMAYKSFSIPAGTSISMSIRDIHFNESLFPNAHEFRPERWLVPSNEKRAMERYLLPFSKGPRSCVGMNLAQAELYLAIGNLFRNFEMKLYETTQRDVSIMHDFFAPFGPTDSKGLRVTVM